MDHLITKEEMQAFMCRTLLAVGAEEDHAKILAECLMTADYRGHFSHGLNRLNSYIHDIQAGHCKLKGTPEILNETVATAYVDGKNLLGVVVAHFCTDIAIRKSKEVGIGMVVAKGSNHFGTADTFSLTAAQQGLIGFCCTNTSPLVATIGGRKPFFGTNPLSVAAIGNKSEFSLDMATSVAAYGKVEIAARKGKRIPPTWAIDETGKPTTDPNKFCALLPLGGSPESGGFKGTGLAFMVELLTGILSGSAFAPNVRKWTDTVADEPANLGQCFIAINPQCFASGFSERLDSLVSNVKNQERAEGVNEIMVSGEPEVKHERHCDRLGGIPYHSNQIDHINEICTKFGVKPPTIKGTVNRH